MMEEEMVVSKLVSHTRKLVAATISPELVSQRSRLREDLGLNSLGLIGLVFFLEEEFAIDVQKYAGRIASSETLADIAQVAIEALGVQQHDAGVTP